MTSLVNRQKRFIQDDLAKNHGVKISLDAVQGNFADRLDHAIQAHKVTYVWPIGNICYPVTKDLKAKDPQTEKANQSAMVPNGQKQGLV